MPHCEIINTDHPNKAVWHIGKFKFNWLTEWLTEPELWVACLLQLLSICFLTDSAEGCHCWSVPFDHVTVTMKTISYPQCQRLAERIYSGTCDCTNTQSGRFVWFTSLHLACYYGQMEIAKCLMRFCQTAAQFQDKTLLTSLMVSFITIHLWFHDNWSTGIWSTTTS